MAEEASRDDPTLAAVQREVSARLSAAGVPSPDHDSVALLAHLLGMGFGEVRATIARGAPVSDGFPRDALEDLVVRRERREPLQHILGFAPFRGIELSVGPGVFVPRPETEVVAGVAIEATRKRAASGVVEVVDLCSGAGAIGLAIAHEVPEARIALVEVDDDAVAWLRRNVEAVPDGVAIRVEVIHADAATALPDRKGDVDVVVSNPPYIPPEGTPIEPEACQDPARALYGLGEDGLEVPRAVVSTAARLLKGGGVLVVEHSDTQGEAMRAMLAASGWWEDIRTGRDLAGRDRFALARRAPGMTNSTCDRTGI